MAEGEVALAAKSLRFSNGTHFDSSAIMALPFLLLCVLVDINSFGEDDLSPLTLLILLFGLG